MNCVSPLEDMLTLSDRSKRMKLGFPAPGRKRDGFFPLTPECAELLVERGFDVMIENGAGEPIKYDNRAYAAKGVSIGSRKDTFSSDVVVTFPPPSPEEASWLKRNAMLFSFLDCESTDERIWPVLLSKKITAVNFGEITHEESGTRIFSTLKDELEGRAAILKATAFMTDSRIGKGILPGALPGIMPCEVVILGATHAAMAAASTALSLGAVVTCFDHDTFRLAKISEVCPGCLVTSVYLPKVLLMALRKADVVIYCEDSHGISFSPEVGNEMKAGVMIFNLGNHPSPFSGFETIDISDGSRTPSSVAHKCFTGAAASVARSAAMVFANQTVNLFKPLDGIFDRINQFRFIERLQNAISVYGGCVVNGELASRLGYAPIEISILLRINS